METHDQLRYPIGKFEAPKKFKKGETKRAIRSLSKFPKLLKDAVKNLSDEQLGTVYREGGWTIRQVVHHVADSHMNAYTRLRLALTEENPVIKPYAEAKWAELTDANTADIKYSLEILRGLHKRWTLLWQDMQPEDFQRTFFHPDSQRNVPLFELAALYAWHGNHHLAHITELKKRKGW